MRTPKENNWQTILFSVLAFIFVVLLLSIPPWDPDLGWHIQNGADILRSGAPMGDIYSHTMPGYLWISHEWLTDVFLYLGQHYWGLLSLSIIFALIVFFAYFISARVAKTRIESTMVAVVVAALIVLPIAGIRPQMITLLGLSVVLWLLFRWRDNPQNKLIWWLPLLFLVWVNVHGGFASGLVLAGTFGLIELIKYLLNKYKMVSVSSPMLNPRRLWELVLVGVVSFGATFINPYTWRIYDELYRTIFNDVVRSGISEWLPVAFDNPQSYNLTIYAVFIALLLIFSWRKVDATKVWIGAVFFIISVASWRNMPLFPLVTLPLLAEMISILAPKGIYYYLRSWWVILIMLGLIFYIGRDRYYTVIPLATDEATFGYINKFPYSAVQFIKQHNISGKMFNEYNWGGYLVWKLPEKKVFIDGRMAIWETPEQNIFEEYLTVTRAGDDALPVLDKYDVSFALVYTDRPIARLLLNHQDEWQLVYRDKLASIFRRSAGQP